MYVCLPCDGLQTACSVSNLLSTELEQKQSINYKKKTQADNHNL